MPTYAELLAQAKGHAEAGNVEEAQKLIARAQTTKSIAMMENQPSAEFQRVMAKATSLQMKMAQSQAQAAQRNAGKAMRQSGGNGGYATITDDQADKALRHRPFSGFGEFLQAVKGMADGVVDERLLPTRSTDAMDEGGFSMTKALGDDFVGSLNRAKALKAAPTGIGESNPSTGGFLVGSERSSGILSRVYESGQLLAQVAMDTIGENSNGMTYHAEDETSRADGSRRGGVRFYWGAENSATTTSSPTFREMELKLRKATAAVYVTEEQLADTAALESYVMRIMPEEVRFGVEDAIINGTGAGQPLGVLNSGGTVEIPKETGQGAATIVSENIIKMWARMWSRSKSAALWVINQDVLPQLIQLAKEIGTGGQLLWMPPNGLEEAPFGRIFGRPIVEHESSQTLGTVGDFMLIDPREYQMIEKGGIESASSMHVRFLQGETCYRFIYRVDGQPAWNSPLMPKNGTNTVSPFITLATRA